MRDCKCKYSNLNSIIVCYQNSTNFILIQFSKKPEKVRTVHHSTLLPLELKSLANHNSGLKGLPNHNSVPTT